MRESFEVKRAPCLDEGLRTAVYPYVQLKEILKPADCRHAILDESQALEAEFGLVAVQPLYNLLWTLNCASGVFTSHTGIAPRNHPPPFEWARCFVAAAIILLSRNRSEHHDEKCAMACADELGRLIGSQPSTRLTTGWNVSVGLCNVLFTTEMDLTTFRSVLPTDAKGYGCQLIVGGAASNRSKAVQRWGDALHFVNSAIQRTQRGDNVRAEAPHRHLLPGTSSLA
jgi:hypothetical protein